jgi:tetratricopeptide (TPR) repeat protein
MWRREAHNEYGYFDATFISAGDYEFWLKIARGRKFMHVREILGLYLESPTSVEHRNAERAAWEVQEARRRHGPKIIPGFRVDSTQAPAAEISNKSTTGQRAKIVALPGVAKLGQLSAPRDALRAKQYSAAWSKSLEAIAQRPFHPEGYLLLAEIALAARDGKAARQCAERVKEMAPEWAAAKKLLKGNVGGQAKFDWMVLPPRPEQPRLSVCLIVKNEEQFLARCLASIKDVATQIVVVDTGSTDRTVEIAKQFGAEVHSFAWNDDFSAARNAALERATGDWVLSLDADEELLPEHKETLRREMQDAGAMAFRLPIIDKGREDEGCSFVPRLFRNAPGLFFLGRVHEQVFSSVQVRAQEWNLKHDLGKTTLLHHGYQKEVVASRNKVERNLRLLELAVKELPNDPNLLMNLGSELMRAGKAQEGLESFFESLRCLGEMPASEITPEMRETLLTRFTGHLLAEKRFDDVINIWQTPAAKAAAQTASQRFALGLAYMERQQPALAAEQMRQCLATRHLSTLSPVNKEILHGGPSHCLALCLTAMEQPVAAAEAFQAALASEPQSRRIRFDYARFLGETGKPLDALRLLNTLAQEDSGDLAVWELGGRLALSKPEFVSFACDWTGEAVKYAASQPAILLQRAEALLLAGRIGEAVSFWGDERLPKTPRARAGLILCETLKGECSSEVAPADELAISQEALKWYRRMIAMETKSVLRQLHERLDALRATLPSFVLTLEKAHSKAAAATAPMA